MPYSTNIFQWSQGLRVLHIATAVGHRLTLRQSRTRQQKPRCRTANEVSKAEHCHGRPHRELNSVDHLFAAVINMDVEAA